MDTDANTDVTIGMLVANIMKFVKMNITDDYTCMCYVYQVVIMAADYT